MFRMKKIKYLWNSGNENYRKMFQDIRINKIKWFSSCFAITKHITSLHTSLFYLSPSSTISQLNTQPLFIFSSLDLELILSVTNIMCWRLVSPIPIVTFRHINKKSSSKRYYLRAWGWQNISCWIRRMKQ